MPPDCREGVTFLACESGCCRSKERLCRVERGRGGRGKKRASNACSSRGPVVPERSPGASCSSKETMPSGGRSRCRSLFGASDRQLEGAVGSTGAKQPRAGRWEWPSGKWPGQAGQSVPFSAACLSLDRHLSGIKERSERPEALEKEQRLLPQAKCQQQQQQQQQVGKRREPGSQSSSKKSAVEGRPVSRRRVDAGAASAVRQRVGTRASGEGAATHRAARGLRAVLGC